MKNHRIRIRRGIDESGIESMVEAAEPVVITRKISIESSSKKNSPQIAPLNIKND
jgi:hypothetical protein